MSTDAAPPRNLAIVRENIRMFGLWRTLFDLVGYLFTGPPRDRFDRKYGLGTTGNVAKKQAGITDEAALADAVRYVPISEQVLRHVLTTAAAAYELSTMSFVDLGSGKGRALVMASWYPFKQVLGVELSPLYAAAATANLEAYRARRRGPAVRCPDVSSVCANALTCELPAGDLFVFMYRPFKGQVFQGVLDRLAALRAAAARRILIAYVCPMEEIMLEQHPAFTRRRELRVIVDEHRWCLWECTGAPARPAATAA